MKYVVKTKHQDGTNYVCVTAEDIVPALNYAQEMTRDGDYPFPLFIESEEGYEICIAVNGLLYQEQDFNEVRQYAEELEGGVE
jgi:hypothetical protein